MAPTCRNIETKRTKIWKNKDLMNLYRCYMMWDLWIINCDIWAHPMNVERSLKGEFYTYYADLCYYEDRFFEFYQMTSQQFDYILERIVPLITKKHSNFRSPISAEQKLVLTITWVLFKLLVRNEFSLLFQLNHVVSHLKWQPLSKTKNGCHDYCSRQIPTKTEHLQVWFNLQLEHAFGHPEWHVMA